MKKRRAGVSVSTRRLTACALLCALNVVFLYLGALFEVLDLSMAVVASFTGVFAVIELGRAAPWMIFAVTGILSGLLLPMPKTPALLYVLFTGYYPILKAYIERLPRLLSLILKLIIFNAALTVLIYATMYVFTGGERAAWVDAVIYVVGNFTFLVYDLAMTRLISIYLRVWRKRFRFDGLFR